MACGTPVVTTERGCCPEVAGDAAVLVDPANPQDIAGGILFFLSDPEVARVYREKGFMRASGFTWERTARGVARVIESVAAET
jgi:glycosyltransferase involved in cell wall biosynthesis